MSWQKYVDDQLISPGHVAQATMISGTDASVWASSGLVLKAGQGAAIISLFKEPAKVFTHGINVDGANYMGCKANERSIYGKKGARGVIAVKTKQTILIAYYNENQQQHSAAAHVERFADYLIDNNL